MGDILRTAIHCGRCGLKLRKGEPCDNCAWPLKDCRGTYNFQLRIEGS